MKKIIIIVSLLILPNQAEASLNCGFKPFKPISCSQGDYICSCGQYGNQCNWILIGC